MGIIPILVVLGLLAGQFAASATETENDAPYPTDASPDLATDKTSLSIRGRIVETIKASWRDLTAEVPHLINYIRLTTNTPGYPRLRGLVAPLGNRVKEGDSLPDDPPIYIDVTVGSVSTSYRGNWSITQGNSGSLGLYTPQPDRAEGGMMLASIYDMTWTPNYYKDTKDTNLTTQTRNVSATVILVNGSYENNKAYYLTGYGYYHPSQKKGIIKMVIPSLTRQPTHDLNQTEIDEIINNPNDNITWPLYLADGAPVETNMSLANCTALNTSTLDQASACNYYLFFSITNATRERKGHVYPPDFAAQILEEGRPIEDNPTEESVPAIEFRLFSSTCCVDMQSRSLIYNLAQEMNQAMIYGGITSLIAIATALICAHSLTKLVSPVRLSQLAMASIIMQTTIDALVAINGVNYAFKFQYAIGPLLLSAVSYFIICLIIDIQLLMLKQRQIMINRNRGLNPRAGLKVYCIFYLVMLASMIISSYVPFQFLFFFFLILSSYWVPQCYYMFKVRSPTVGYTYTYVIFTTILRTGPVWYFYCYESNFLGYQTIPIYSYLLFAWVLIQLGCMIGLMVTTKSRYKAFLAKESHSVYTYTNQLLSQHVVANFDYFSAVEPQLKEGETAEQFFKRLERDSAQSFPFPMHYFHKPNQSIQVFSAHASVAVLPSEEEILQESDFLHRHCMNPLHKHSELYSEGTTINDLAQYNTYLQSRLACQEDLKRAHASDPDATLTNCFYLLKAKDVSEYVICSICFDYIPLTNRHLCLFKDTRSKPYEADTHAIKELLEEINTSGKLSGEDSTYNLQQQQQQRGNVQDYERELWITPCGHVFHASCLRRWMDETLQCPVDRAPLPLPAY